MTTDNMPPLPFVVNLKWQEDELHAYARAYAEQQKAYLTRLSRDDAETILWQSIEAAGKVGNKTDDKLILTELCKRSIVLCRVDNEGMADQIRAEQQTAELRAQLAVIRDENRRLAESNAKLLAGIVPEGATLTITPAVYVMRPGNGPTIEDVAAGVWVENVEGKK